MFKQEIFDLHVIEDDYFYSHLIDLFHSLKSVKRRGDMLELVWKSWIWLVSSFQLSVGWRPQQLLLPLTIWTTRRKLILTTLSMRHMCFLPVGRYANFLFVFNLRLKCLIWMIVFKFVILVNSTELDYTVARMSLTTSCACWAGS